MDGQADLELERPRGALQLIGTTFDLYWRYPVLFLILAAVVLVPYELIVLAATGTGALDRGSLGFAVGALLNLIDLGLVTSLISALHVHAVHDVREGRRPKVADVARRGVATLPVVSLAVLLSYLGILLGFVALIVPGFFLLARWAVAGPAAALGDGGWKDALRRSEELAESEHAHVLGLVILVLVITSVPSFFLARAFEDTDTTTTSFLIDLALQIVIRSFTALATALLYFDLKGRLGVASVNGPDIAGPGSAATAGSTAERPAGWYVDPGNPRRMRYWAADGSGNWSTHTAKTPKEMRREWQEGHRGMAAPLAQEDSDGTPEPTGRSFDPGAYTDEERPAGWYVDPGSPWRMRYWGSEGGNGWSRKTTKTPKQVLANWRDLRWQRERS